VDEEIRVKTWQARLFELIKRGRGYVACPGGTGTLVELAVVWEMLNKGAMSGKPLVVLGDFWQPVIERVREVELGHPSRFGEHGEPLVHVAASPADAAGYFAEYFQAHR
jgi:predicted Rossmann-fold nucleotide-binding protein